MGIIQTDIGKRARTDNKRALRNPEAKSSYHIKPKPNDSNSEPKRSKQQFGSVQNGRIQYDEGNK